MNHDKRYTKPDYIINYSKQDVLIRSIRVISKRYQTTFGMAMCISREKDQREGNGNIIWERSWYCDCPCMVLFLECGHVFTCGYSEGLTHTVPSSAHLQEQPNIIGQHSNNNTSHSPTVKTGLHYCLAGTPEGKFFPLSHLPKCLFLSLPPPFFPPSPSPLLFPPSPSPPLFPPSPQVTIACLSFQASN